MEYFPFHWRFLFNFHSRVFLIVLPRRTANGEELRARERASLAVRRVGGSAGVHSRLRSPTVAGATPLLRSPLRSHLRHWWRTQGPSLSLFKLLFCFLFLRKPLLESDYSLRWSVFACVEFRHCCVDDEMPIRLMWNSIWLLRPLPVFSAFQLKLIVFPIFFLFWIDSLSLSSCERLLF